MRLRAWLAGMSVPVLVGLSSLLASPAEAAVSLPIKPPAPAPVTGIPEPCVSRAAWPAQASPERTVTLLQKQYGLTLTGTAWTESKNRPLVKIVWETLDAISCTDYLSTIKAKNQNHLVINASRIGGWAWGDWGLTTPGALTLDFEKWHGALPDDPGRLVRLLIHEMGHAYNVDRDETPAYWAEFQRLYRAHGRFSAYGKNDTETFSDVLGYFVARCAKDNPFDKGQAAYYEFARTRVFGGLTFGSAPGSPVKCSGAYKAMTIPSRNSLPGWAAPELTKK